MSDRLARRTGSALVWRTVQVVGGRGLSLLRILILARLLAPDAFGLVAVAMVALDMGLALTQLGITEELVQRDDIDRRHYDTAWTVGVVRAAVLAGILMLAAPLIASLFDDPAATPIVRVLALRPLVESLASVRLVDLVRGLRFRALAVLETGAAVVELAVAIGVVLVLAAGQDGVDGARLAGADGAWAVVAGALAGVAVRSLASYALAPHRVRFTFDREAWGSLFRFGRWVAANQIVALVGAVALRVIVAQRLGTGDLGVFYLALRLTALPNEVVGGVVSAVGFPVVAQVREDLARAARTFRGMLQAMLLLLAPAYAVLAVLAATLTDVLGPQWDGLAPVLVLLAIDGVVDVPADATQPLVFGLGRPALHALQRAVRTAVILAVAWPFTGWWGVAGAAAAYLTAEAVQGVVAIRIAANSVPSPLAGIWPRVAGIAVVAAAAAGAAALVDLGLSGIPALVAGGLAAAAVGSVALIVIDRVLGVGLTADLARAFPATAARLGLAAGQMGRMPD